MIVISAVLLCIVMICLSYLMLLAIAAIKDSPSLMLDSSQAKTRFMIVLPAHNEENVIQRTVSKIFELNYPLDMFTVHVVADHCSDRTARKAEEAGAYVHERYDEPRSGKGTALNCFFDQTLSISDVDAVVVFDADTQVDRKFLLAMDERIRQGCDVVQGQHIISNPEDGWFPALTWSMFIVDNQFQNQGRSNLGLSAKHMRDSIAFKADILNKLGWGAGLTEDYQLRQRLLLEGYSIAYEDEAIGYSEAPRTWRQARAQRERWLQGVRQANENLAYKLLCQGILTLNISQLDGALQAYLPSYSTLTLFTFLIIISHYMVQWLFQVSLPTVLMTGWLLVLLVQYLYPFTGLLIARAPRKAYLAMVSGPIFILWRTWLLIRMKLGAKKVIWIRTAHGKNRPLPD